MIISLQGCECRYHTCYHMFTFAAYNNAHLTFSSTAVITNMAFVAIFAKNLLQSDTVGIHSHGTSKILKLGSFLHSVCAGNNDYVNTHNYIGSHYVLSREKSLRQNVKFNSG